MTRPPSRQPYPWVVPDLFRWFAMLGAAAVGLTVAWWQLSGTAQVNRLITWLNVAAAAVVVSGLGNMTWLLQGRRAVAARRRQLLPPPPATTPLGSAADTGPEEGGLRVAVPATTRYHRPGCPAVAGKPVERMPLDEHERAGRRPCGLCER